MHSSKVLVPFVLCLLMAIPLTLSAQSAVPVWETEALLGALAEDLGGWDEAEQFLADATDQELATKLEELRVVIATALPPTSSNIRDCPVRFGSSLRGLPHQLGTQTVFIDTLGRPREVLQILPAIPALRDNRCQRDVGNLGNNLVTAPHKPYDGGHFIAAILGGWKRRANLAPMNRTLNTGNWARAERRIASCPVTRLGTMQVLALYEGASDVPESWRMKLTFPVIDPIHKRGGTIDWTLGNEPRSSSNTQTADRRTLENALAQLGCGRALRKAVFDDTGSMGPEADGMKAALNDFVDQGDSTENIEWGLITFKDNVTNVGSTFSRSTFKNWINAVSVSGGDDCPEESIGALWAAAQELAAGDADDLKEIVLVTDADPQPGDYQGLAAFAKDNEIRISTLLTGTCGSSRGTGEQKEGGDETLAVGPTSSLNGQTVFSTLANETGGIYRFAPGLSANGYRDLLAETFFEGGLAGTRSVSKLTLTSMCWVDNSTHIIRVRNPNAFDVYFEWERYGSSLEGDGRAKASSDTFVEISGLNINSGNTIKLYWEDGNGNRRSTTKALNRNNC
ncbi:MAG: DNA/RNA non-specific endonuclease [Acidobacteriota bacterium]